MNGLFIGTVIFFIAMPIIAVAVCAHLLKDSDAENAGSGDHHAPTPLV